MGKYGRNASEQKGIARERVAELFRQADSIFPDKKLANRYVTLARKIAMKYKVRVPSELKRKFCKHCYSYLRPGANARVRLTKSNIVTYCEKCKKFSRFNISKKKK